MAGIQIRQTGEGSLRISEMKMRKAAVKENIKKIIMPLMLAVVLLCHPVSIFAEDTYYLTWEEYCAANGITDSYTYNQAVDGMEQAMDAAESIYASGDAETTLEIIKAVKNSYWGGSGLKVAMQKQLPSASKKTAEADFTSCNSIVRNGGSA